MSGSEIPFGIERSRLRLAGKDTYLCLHFTIVYVRDLDRSLRFYTEQLGFTVVVDHTFPNGNRWIEISPPDGNANIGLTLAPPDVDVDSLISRETRIWFITEDVTRTYNEWGARRVHFRYPPEVPVWGGFTPASTIPTGTPTAWSGSMSSRSP